MARLGKEELLNVVVESIRAGGARVLVVRRTHPFLLDVSDDSVQAVQVYVWNLTHGGGDRSEDEYRIQLTGVELPIVEPSVGATVLLGWDDGRRVFAAFDVRHHRDPKESDSVQIKGYALNGATARGEIVVYRRQNGEAALALPPELLLAYLRDRSALHDFGESAPTAAIGQQVLAEADSEQATEAVLAGLPDERLKVLRRVVLNVRDASFRRRVTEAYGHACAMCDVQLELVEAAHIVPVSDPASTDEIQNGLALCALHHTAYDQGLIEVRRDATIQVNAALLQRLHEENLGNGAADFARGLRDELRPPTREEDRPLAQYLERGSEIRRLR